MAWYWWGTGAALLTLLAGTTLTEQGWAAVLWTSVWCGVLVSAVAFWLTRPTRDTGVLRSPFNQSHAEFAPRAPPPMAQASPYASANPFEPQ